ncbi:MAG: extracellular solute-binding protein [Phycisphaerales bacterium]|nr:extracellular solute-binding protein [Phycisphaerales bacterium]
MNRLTLYIALLAVLVLTITPVLLYRGAPRASGVRTLVIVTPHNEQIRSEFSNAFMRWHQKNFGELVDVAWNAPGGTTEIRRMLVAQYEAALRHDVSPGGDADLLFGGGSYEFELLSRPLTVGSGADVRTTTILQPCTWLTANELADLYGTNTVDGRPLYDAKLHWFGVALSTFGIVSNVTQCEARGIDPPKYWAELANPALFEAIALSNPAQSGSVATAFETILQRLGWERGWQVLRRAAANSNQILASSSVIPTTVGSGESCAGIAIDFYGRYQVQVLQDHARKTQLPSINRLTFCTPIGESVVDADPIAILRGAPNLELAKRFVQFCLSLEGQLLWQLPHGSAPLCGYQPPEHYSLRRMPARRAAYECCESCFVDAVDPFAEQSPLVSDPNFRDFVAPIFVSMAMDDATHLRAAWRAIFSHPAYPRGGGIITAADVSDPTLKEWLTAFDSMPTVAGPDNVLFHLRSVADLAAVRQGWIKGKFAGKGLWDERDQPRTLLRQQFSAFFSTQYRQITQGAARANLTH